MTSLTELQITMIDIERRLHNLEMCIESIWKEWQVIKEKEIGKFENGREACASRMGKK
jgi:hypothetical protein